MAKSLILAAMAVITIASSLPTNAMDLKVGDLIIRDQTIRATVPTAKVAAGYLSITNSGSEPDRLLGGHVDFAGIVDVHEMKINDGVMTMRSVPEGLVIPAGHTVVLKPGAEHIMFMKLREQMKEGEIRTVVLQFEKAGKVEIKFTVGNLAGMQTDHKHDHNHKKDDSHSHSGHSSE